MLELGGFIMKIIDLSFHEDKSIQHAAELLLNCFEHSWSTLEEAIEEVKESLGSDRISRVAIDEQGNLIGWISGVKQYEGNVWGMHPLVVNKSWQSKRIGTLLVDDFERRVSEKGGLTILLGTDDEDSSTSVGGIGIYNNLQDIRNLKNHPFEFYQKVGYKIVGVIPDANGIGKPDILMAKRVKG